MDAKDPLEVGPVRLITEPALSPNNPDSTTQTAGTTFFGQFVDHDVTFDLGSALNIPTRPEDSTNTRSPALDLDSVYGGGPVRSPQLYGRRSSREPLAGIKLRVEHGGLFEDLPRNADGTAILGDPRNDEHVILAGLHAAFLLFHNEAVDYVAARNRRSSTDEIFREAQRLVRWHYQWIIVHEFLPQIIGQPLVNSILQRRRIYTPSVGFMPVEFQGACYRMGHSMVRPSYRANLAGDNGQAFFAFIFDPSQEGAADPSDLRGGVRTPRRFVGWQTFFDFGDTQVRPNKRLDTSLSTPLFQLPLLGDCQRRWTAIARGAQPSAPRHVVAAVGTIDRACDGCAGAVERGPRGYRRARCKPGPLDAAVVLHPEGGARDRAGTHARPGRRPHRR